MRNLYVISRDSSGMDLRFMASFPFHQEAIQYIKSNSEEFASISELASDILFTDVREMALERIHCALERRDIPIDFHSEDDCRNEIMAYIVARIIVASTRDTHLIRWYSLSEAVRTDKLLKLSSWDDVLSVADSLGFSIHDREDDHVMLQFIDYLRSSTSLKSYEWKLSNQALSNGLVRISREKLIRLMQQALKAKFEHDLTEMKVPDSIKQNFSETISEILGISSKMIARYESHAIKVVVPGRFPPCIQHLIDMTRGGENVPHSGRFAMTSFLLHIGMGVDEIIGLFKVSPDFREDLARYQVEHIAGEISGTDYESMACKTMITYGLCIGKDVLCNKINHPLSYYDAKNDDTLPEEERKMRRSLTAAHEIARSLRIPVTTIQKSVTDWFQKHALIPLPLSQIYPNGDPSVHDLNRPEIKQKKAEIDINIGAGGEGGSDTEADGRGTRPGSVKESKARSSDEPVDGRNNQIEGEPSDEPNEKIKDAVSSNEILMKLDDPKISRPVGNMYGIPIGEPRNFDVRVLRAWLTGMKVTYPGSMEDRYIISTTGSVEDQGGRVMRIFPVHTFFDGQMIRDLQKSGTVLRIAGQVFEFRNRRFLHVIKVTLPEDK
jgi:DNA primase large subunit